MASEKDEEMPSIEQGFAPSYTVLSMGGQSEKIYLDAPPNPFPPFAEYSSRYHAQPGDCMPLVGTPSTAYPNGKRVYQGEIRMNVVSPHVYSKK